ncbi:hypothetical protein SNEBB_009449 [Seison nebaliae]|nr:hypothetical protein SNEBB_009449 [Seison nebaliae]
MVVTRLMILGAPGSGKGTIGKRILKLFPKMTTLVMGDVLRQEIRNKSKIGLKVNEIIKSGQLVSDDVINELISVNLKKFDRNKNLLFDGYPRTVEQAEYLHKSQYDIEHVIHVDVPDDEIISRITDRLYHPGSGRIYNLSWNPPKKEGLDDVTGEKLIRRDDDKREVIEERLSTYHSITVNVIDFYKSKNRLSSFAGRETNKIWPEIDHHQILMERLLNARMGGGGGAGALDAPTADTAEQVYISSLALLKMLKHGRAGVPMEVMGLMLGEFVDDYTVQVTDVFAMPQSGTGVSVEAVDPVFQAKMLDMLKQTGRPEMVVGWYHSHPGFGCWLSGVDVSTQQSFEALSERAVAVVIDPIQSVRGKVVIDAFRLITQRSMVLRHEPRQTTSNIGHLEKPSVQALIHGLNRQYYSMPINYRKNNLEQKMLLNLHKKEWTDGLELKNFPEQTESVEEIVEKMLPLMKNYQKSIEEEDRLNENELEIRNVGKQDPKRHLEESVNKLLTTEIVQSFGTMVSTIAFK